MKVTIRHDQLGSVANFSCEGQDMQVIVAITGWEGVAKEFCLRCSEDQPLSAPDWTEQEVGANGTEVFITDGKSWMRKYIEAWAEALAEKITTMESMLPKKDHSSLTLPGEKAKK